MKSNEWFFLNLRYTSFDFSVSLKNPILMEEETKEEEINIRVSF